MKKPLKIFICLVAAILVIGTTVTIWQWDNITALRYSLTMSKETMTDNIAQNDQQLKDVLAEYKIPEYVFSQAELAKMAGNEDAVEAAVATLLQMPPTANQGNPGKTQVDISKKTKPQTKQNKQPVDYTQKIRTQIAKMYVLKATYVSELDGIASATQKEFEALPPEQKTDSKKQAVLMKRFSQISALEKECDHKVATVVAELRKLLKADGQNGSTADLIESTYAQEKSLKKAYYLQKAY